MYIIADIGKPGSVQSKTTITYVAVSIGGAFLVVVMCVIVVLVMVAIMKKQSRQIVAGMYIRTYRYTLNVCTFLWLV